MLTLAGVTKAFGGRPVLNGVDLEIGAGESVALLGANGSGKTTTLRCAVGLARADSGRIAIAGVDLARDPIRARSRLSYLPQKSVFPPMLTVRETLGLASRLRGLTRREVDRELNWCGLAALADRSIRDLSGGERQRLAMAVAFLPSVELYLFDEPSANLDPAASRLLFQRARQLEKDGRTLLFTTHVPADVRRLATRIVLLREGRIASDTVGAFEVRRYERLLEREMWGEEYDDSMRRPPVGDSVAFDNRLHDAPAAAAAGAARSR